MSVFEYLAQLLSPKFIAIILLTIILLKYLSKKWARDPRLVEFAEKMPGPYAYPIVGSTFSVLYDMKDGMEPFFTKYLMKYGPVARFWLGNGLGIMLSDPQEVETALLNSNCLSRSPGTDVFRIIFGNSLLLATPLSRWKQKRREFQIFFNKNNLEHHTAAINEKIQKFTKECMNSVEGPENDWLKPMYNLSFDIFSKTFLNYELTNEEKAGLDLLEKLHLAFMQLSLKWLFPTRLTDTIARWLVGTDLLKLREKLISFIDKTIKSNQLKQTNGEKLMVKNSNSKSVPRDFINMLLQMEKEMDEDYLVYGDISFLLMAGTDSVTISVSNCLLALAASPEIQERVYQEIYQVFGDEKVAYEKSDLERLTYLNQVIKECLRVFTVIPAMYRLIENDAQIGPRLYPKGSFIVINVAGIHHNPKLYPDPYRFNPDNFSEEAVSKRHRCSFLPFGLGPRNCIGKEFAELNLKLRLITLLRTFSFHTTVKLEDIKFKQRVLETLVTGYPLSIKLRKKTRK